jgi:hypothetical protein
MNEAITDKDKDSHHALFALECLAQVLLHLIIQSAHACESTYKGRHTSQNTRPPSILNLVTLRVGACATALRCNLILELSSPDLLSGAEACVHVCVYGYDFICVWYISIISMCMHVIYVCMYVIMQVCKYVCMYACM